LRESLKHRAQFLARNADAGVRDREPQCGWDGGVRIRRPALPLFNLTARVRAASSGGQKLIVTADEAFLSRIGE
jgi:hypothetical protein